jgi:hypothetical protein
MGGYGLHTTTADEQYDRGLAAGRAERAKGLDEDAIERRLKFDRSMAESQGPVFGRFHQGRIDGMTGQS